MHPWKYNGEHIETVLMTTKWNNLKQILFKIYYYIILFLHFFVRFCDGEKMFYSTAYWGEGNTKKVILTNNVPTKNT